MSKLSDSSRCLTMKSTQLEGAFEFLHPQDIFQSLRDWNHRHNFQINFIKMLNLLCVSNVEAAILPRQFDVILSHRYVNTKNSEKITYLYRVILYWWTKIVLINSVVQPKKKLFYSFAS
jgi:hypothetical protein